MTLRTRKAIQIQNLILQDMHQIFLELDCPVRPFISNNETNEDRDGQIHIVVKKDDFEDYLVLWIKAYENNIIDIKNPLVSVGFREGNFEVKNISHIYNADDYYFWKYDVLKEKIKKVLGI
jgi:hypothetical protein